MRRFVDTIKRNKVKKEANEKIQKEKGEFIMVDDMHLLENQRCEIKFSGDDEFNDLFSDT